MDERGPCLLGLAGRMKSGRTSLAKSLEGHGFVSISFDDEIRKEVARGWGMSFKGWLEFEKANPEVLRMIILAWGHTRRILSGENYWVLKVMEQIQYHSHVVIDDVRYPNEVKAIEGYGGHVGWIEVSPEEQVERGANYDFLFDESETALDSFHWVPAFMIDSDISTKNEVVEFVEWWLQLGGYL